jgi:hypothetical protein
MRFLADVCLHVEIGAVLRQAGHEVPTIAPSDTGASDEAVLGRLTTARFCSPRTRTLARSP